MTQCGAGPRFTAKARQGLFILHQVVRQEFDRDESLEFNVTGAVNDSHSAAAQFVQHFIVRDGSTNKCIRAHRSGSDQRRWRTWIRNSPASGSPAMSTAVGNELSDR